MARTGGRGYAWVAGGYSLIGLFYLFRHYYAFGLMWLFFGLGALAEFLRGRNDSHARWWNAAKWTSLALGLVMIGMWLFVRS